MARKKIFTRSEDEKAPESPGRIPDAASAALAREKAKLQDDPDQIYAPTATSNPSDPRTAGASYYSLSQVLVVQWGDGGRAYAYYDVTPQEWDAFQNADSPGKFINAVLNNHNYGPISTRRDIG